MVLSSVEIFFNFSAWTLAVFYSLYNFYLACKIFENQEDIYNDFSSGWSLINRKKDRGDLEWQTIIYILKKLLIWCFLSTIISQYLKLQKVKSTTIHGFHLLTTLIFLIFNVNHLLIIGIITQPILFRLFYEAKRMKFIWLCMLICFAIITFIKWNNEWNEGLLEFAKIENENDFYISIIASCWMTMRCFSYFIDLLQDAEYKNERKERTERHKEINLNMNNVEYFAYCLYLPTLICGPFISFKDYIKIAKVSNKQPKLSTSLWRLIKQLLRILFWMEFTEFALHFIYVNPMLYQIEHVRNFNSWTIYGYGYAMGQYFHLKYVILYGFSLSFCEFAGIPVPNWPKCIGRIHVYSDMWKYFDRGFYIFLLRYLYIPLVGKSRSLGRQFLASFICFLFVYIWHGIHFCIFIWTAINFFTISIEKIFKYIMNTKPGKSILSVLNDSWNQRLHAIVAAPLLAISAMSNAYFFADKNIGDSFFIQFYESTFHDKLIFFGLLYFCGQVGIEVRKWEKLKNYKVN